MSCVRRPSSRIQDPQMRSRALFTEAAKVIMNPRCVNCHPATDHPLQGNDQHIHMPPVPRGESGDGIGGNTCGACHMERNVTLHEAASYQSVPGNPRWGLAPIEMAWQGKSMTEICTQIKDPARSGRNLTQRRASTVAWLRACCIEGRQSSTPMRLGTFNRVSGWHHALLMTPTSRSIRRSWRVCSSRTGGSMASGV